MALETLRSRIAGKELFARAAEYDSEGNKISTSLESKQDVISDIAEIRSGAAAGATAYQKPTTGIPSSDMTSEVQTSIGLADSAIQHVYAGTDELIPDNTRTVTIPYAEVIPAHTVTIGGRSYKTVTMPDGNEWLAENLDYEWDNLPIGATGEPSTPAGWYYNDQKNNYGIDGTYKCGLLYNGHAVDYLSNNKDTLIPGWHVATKAEWEALFAATGGWSATGPHLKARDHSITGTFPNNWNGTDDYEFGVLPGGYRGVRPYVPPYSSFGEWVCYWTGTELYSEQSYYVTFGDSTGPGESTAYKTDAYYVRLVKDSPTGTGPVYKGGLMTSSMVDKLDGIEAHAQVNTIESISVNSVPTTISNKNVDIQIPKAVPDPTASSQMLFSTNGTAWTPMTWEVQKYATIGGKDYPTVTIGDQEWLAVNLDMAFSGLAVGESGTSTSASQANYLDNDGSTNGWTGNRDGLLYNWTAVNYMETNKATLFPGWHVPTATEYDTLSTTLGAETAGTQLKSTSGWSENNGDGSTEFNARPVGNYDGTFVNTGSGTSLWTMTSSGDNATASQLTTAATVSSATLDKGIQCSVRLVKDSA